MVWQIILNWLVRIFYLTVMSKPFLVSLKWCFRHSRIRNLPTTIKGVIKWIMFTLKPLIVCVLYLPFIPQFCYELLYVTHMNFSASIIEYRIQLLLILETVRGIWNTQFLQKKSNMTDIFLQYSLKGKSILHSEITTVWLSKNIKTNDFYYHSWADGLILGRLTYYMLGVSNKFTSYNWKYYNWIM